MPNLENNSLLSLSPLDGRYRAKCEELNPYFKISFLLKIRKHTYKNHDCY